jgi:hypothetical protein
MVMSRLRNRDKMKIPQQNRVVPVGISGLTSRTEPAFSPVTILRNGEGGKLDMASAVSSATCDRIFQRIIGRRDESAARFRRQLDSPRELSFDSPVYLF